MDRIDEAVEVALDARDRVLKDVDDMRGADVVEVDAMRAALLASFPVLLGEPVAWQARYVDPEEGPGSWASMEARHIALLRDKPGFEVRSLYAPSLGEGDGR